MSTLSRTSISARAATPAAERAPTPTDLRDSRPSPIRATGLTVENEPVIRGVIVDPDAGPPAPTRRLHDSQTQVRSDGIGPRLFDPATKKDVRVDETGAVLGDRNET